MRGAAVGRRQRVEPVGQRLQVAVRRADVQAGSETGKKVEGVVGRIGKVAGHPVITKGGGDFPKHAERQPEFRRQDGRHAAEPSGRDSDDGVGLAVDPQGAADEVGPATLALPKPVAGDDHMPGGVGLGFRRVEKTPGGRPDAAEREEVVRNQKSEGAPEAGLIGQPDLAEAERGDVAENLAGLPQPGEFRMGERPEFPGRIAARDVHADVGARLLVHDGTEQKAVDHGKDRRVRADRQRQCQHRDRRESRLLAEQPQGKTKVLAQILQPTPPALRPRPLLDDRHVAELPQCRAARLVRVHPGLKV